MDNHSNINFLRSASGKQRIVAIRRADRFSPNNVERDRLILKAVTDIIHGTCGISVPIIDEDEFCSRPVAADVCLSMGRMPATLDLLASMEERGCLVVNSPKGVRICAHRSLLDSLMRSNGIAMPPLHGEHGTWLKRGDDVAQGRGDVVYCHDDNALEKAKGDFALRGIKEMVVSTHVEGDLIKFYGVNGNMFNYSYTNDGGRSKFGNERINGEPHHYHFDEAALCREVRHLAALANVVVYGGDAIIDKDGNFYIIDFNDWPTFANCREEAAEAIARYVTL